MVAKAKVQGGGPVTIPDEILNALGVEPGDSLTFRRTGPSTVELAVWPRVESTEEAPRAGTEGEGNTGSTNEIGRHGHPEAATGLQEAVDIDDLPPLSLTEMFERYRIEGSFDEATLRQEWQDEAYKEVFGSRGG